MPLSFRCEHELQCPHCGLCIDNQTLINNCAAV